MSVRDSTMSPKYISVQSRALTRTSWTFTRHEKLSLIAMVSFVLLLHVVGWGLLLLTVSKHLELGSTGAFGIGLGVTA